MNSQNPFLCSNRNPCRENPVTILEVQPGTTQATIRLSAEMKEKAVLADDQPSNIPLARGQCIAAAQQLQDPVQRLAFTLMSGGFTPHQEKL